MLLSALNELYGRLAEDERYAIAQPGFSLQKITFRVVIHPDGRLHAIEDARDHDGKRPKPRQMLVPGGAKPSGPGINPNLLWDQSRYMLGFTPDDSNPERTAECFDAFRRRHTDLEAEVGLPAFSSVCRFLEQWKPEDGGQSDVLADAATTGFGVFSVLGAARAVHQLPELGSWWTAKEGGTDPDALIGQCLVSGARAPVARTHDKIRGVAGAQGAGAALVGFNDAAYESHGLSQSFNAPVSEEVAFRYATALNALLDGPARDRHRLTLGDTTVVFWTGRPTPAEDAFMAFLGKGGRIVDDKTQDDAVLASRKGFLEALRRGRSAGGMGESGPEGRVPFYLLGLSPNGGRVSQRFIYRDTLSTLYERLGAHFRDIGLEPSPPRGKRKGDPEFPSLRDLLEQTAREPKNIPPLIEGALIHSIVEGARYPYALFAAVIRRIHADRRVDYLRCCVLKGYLNRNLNKGLLMALDDSRSDPPYLLGRLFAALEKTQEDALGGTLNKTIRDSFYSSASATPGVVFPRLLRTYQHHLSKLQGGHRVNRERLIQAILSGAENFPRSFDLSEQGAFAIGYYHQRQAFFTPSKTSEND